jgi:hypothetical protein
MAINQEKKEAKRRLFGSIAKSDKLEQLISCERLLNLYEKEYGKNEIIRFYLDSRKKEFPEEV